MRFSLATAAHEVQLRRLVRDQAMPGWVRLAFASEPDWVPGQAVLGSIAQTIVTTIAAETVVACAIRAIRRVYINGQEAEIGYLGGLRSLPAARGSFGLVQGFRFLRQLHDADHRVPAYLTTIVEDNRKVAGMLTSERAGLPAYLDQGRFITSAVFLDRRKVLAPPPAGIEIRTGNEVPLDDILAFLREEGRTHQFFPVLKAADLGTPQWRGLTQGHFRVALRAGAIVAVAAAWDQTAFRQTVVAGYTPVLQLARPMMNTLLRLAGRPTLPVPGQRLSFFHLAFTCIQHNDPVVFAALLERFHANHRSSPFHCFVVGLHERNPARVALRSFRALHYASRLYLACWEDGRAFAASLDPDRIPHLETGSL